MISFKYQARDKAGKYISGIEQANTRSSVIEQLRSRGLFPINVEQVKYSEKVEGSGLSDRELVFFTRQLSNLLGSGVPLARALDLIKNQTKNHKIKQVSEVIHSEVAEGGYFWEALAKYPAIFSRVYIGMVKAAELGGDLKGVFNHLADFMERKKETRDSLVSMLVYPFIVLGTGVVTVIFLLSFVIPKMLFIFTSNDAELPLMTKLLIALSLFFSRYWWLLFLLSIALFFAVRIMYRQEKTRLFLDQFVFQIPWIGQTLQKAVLARFSYVLGLLLSNGLSILECLDIARDVIQNKLIRLKVENVRFKVSQGSSLFASMGQENFFPQAMLDMILIGEETGGLEQSLLKIAEIYDKEMKEETKRMLTIIEPALIFFIAAIVGLLVMAMLLPIFQFNLQVL